MNSSNRIQYNTETINLGLNYCNSILPDDVTQEIKDHIYNCSNKDNYDICVKQINFMINKYDNKKNFYRNALIHNMEKTILLCDNERFNETLNKLINNKKRANLKQHSRYHHRNHHRYNHIYYQ